MSKQEFEDKLQEVWKAKLPDCDPDCTIIEKTGMVVHTLNCPRLHALRLMGKKLQGKDVDD